MATALSLEYIVEPAYMKNLEELANLNLLLFSQDNENELASLKEASLWMAKRLRYNYSSGEKDVEREIEYEETDTYFYILRRNSAKKKQKILGYAIYVERGGRRPSDIGKILELEQFGVTPYSRDIHKFLLDESISRLDEDIMKRVGVGFATIMTIVDKDRTEEIFLPRFLGENYNKETIQNTDGSVQVVTNSYSNLNEVNGKDRIDQILIIVSRETINKAREYNKEPLLLESYEIPTEPQTKSQRRKLQ